MPLSKLARHWRGWREARRAQVVLFIEFTGYELIDGAEIRWTHGPYEEDSWMVTRARALVLHELVKDYAIVRVIARTLPPRTKPPRKRVRKEQPC